jgi:hypothetical protein
METGDRVVERTPGEERLRREEERLSHQGMRLLTGNLTHEGDSFLMAVGAAALMGLLYPLVDFWSMLAFPVVFAIAVIARSRARRRGRASRSSSARSRRA